MTEALFILSLYWLRYKNEREFKQILLFFLCLFSTSLPKSRMKHTKDSEMPGTE